MIQTGGGINAELPLVPRADVVIQVVSNQGKIKQLRGLFDTGWTKTVFLKDFLEENNMKKSKNPIRYGTYGGSFVADCKARVAFKFPEFDTHRKEFYEVTVNKKNTPKESPYDAIIRTDLMGKLGIDINFSEKTITWDGITIPLKDNGVYRKRNNVRHADQAVTQGREPAISQQKERSSKILDADYSAVDIKKTVDKMTHISPILRKQLNQSLKKFPTLFSVGLGKLNGVPKVYLETHDKAIPFHGKPYPIMKKYEKMTAKEIRRLCKIGVLQKVNNLEWASPTFIQPKKTGMFEY